MIAKIGFCLLILIVATAGCLSFLAFFGKKNKANMQKIYTLNYFLLLIAFCCKLCLIYSFIISDYSLLNVYQNSHHLKPLIFKIAGAWGSHEGSMLLLILVLLIYNTLFLLKSKLDLSININTVAIQTAIITLFSFYTLVTSNPFLPVFPVATAGLGLNPLLQDIGLALHPPMLYCGYLGSILVFSLTIAAVITNNLHKQLLKQLHFWLYFTFASLTTGIALGAWWAYRELGWGGYWFWDPVENISLMPWLACIMLIHCLLLIKKQEKFKLWLVFLVVVNAVLCLLGIFLTRSGLLTSVHTFAVDTTRGFAMMCLVLFVGVFGFLIFAYKFNEIAGWQKNKKSDIFPLLTQNYFLLLFLLIVFVGTLYPVLANGLWQELITIGPTYYQNIFSIGLIPFLLLLSVASWQHLQKLQQKKIILIIVATFIASVIIYFKPEKDYLIVGWCLIFALTLAIFTNILTPQKISAKIAHLGFLFLLVGIIANGYFDSTKETQLNIGNNIEMAGINIQFHNTQYLVGKNFLSNQGIFHLIKQQKKIATLTPELRYYPVSNQTTNETSIYHYWLGDLAIVLGTKDENNSYAVRIYHKPLIYAIWLGCLMMCGSFLTIILKNKLL
jgi:cytochrome c-type biogenesis protein CcmF